MLSVTLDRYYRNLQKKLTLRRILLCFLAFLILYTKTILVLNKCPEEVKPEVTVDSRPKYMLHTLDVDIRSLKHVIAVLDRLGYRRVNNTKDFDLLWSHVYPFGQSAPFAEPFFRNLKPHQKVNHIPGSGFFTNKVHLATTQSKYIPKTFKLPDEKVELLKHAAENPDQMFVRKSNTHRQIEIVKVAEMNLDMPGVFAQEFIDDPYLIDGYKFDIGVYTVVTSIDPLRVYIYNGDVLIRFCGKPYKPFDPDDVDRYVVGDDYTPIWKVPSLKKSYNDRKFGMMETLNTYIRGKGQNPTKIWSQIEDSIVSILLNKEEDMARIMKRYKNVGNFFEMVRFDFIIDSQLNVYLMEANMSPNLSSEHFPPNRLLYENVIFGLFALVGLGKRTHVLAPRTVAEDQMEVPEKVLMVFGDECSGEICDDCGVPYCLLCKHCITPPALRTLKQSYLEHVNRMDYKRIFPPKMNPKTKLDEINLDKYSPENRFLMLWFLGKCQRDKTWC